MNRQVAGWIGWVGLMYEWDEWMDGWMDELPDGWMNRWIGWADGLDGHYEHTAG